MLAFYKQAMEFLFEDSKVPSELDVYEIWWMPSFGPWWHLRIEESEDVATARMKGYLNNSTSTYDIETHLLFIETLKKPVRFIGRPTFAAFESRVLTIERDLTNMGFDGASTGAAVCRSGEARLARQWHSPFEDMFPELADTADKLRTTFARIAKQLGVKDSSDEFLLPSRTNLQEPLL